MIGDKRSLAERAAEAFERTVGQPRNLEEPVDPVRLARLEEALRSLRKLDREIFLAHRLDAMSYEEIARRTGLSVRQVERRMRRALREVAAFMCDQAVRRRRWCRY